MLIVWAGCYHMGIRRISVWVVAVLWDATLHFFCGEGFTSYHVRTQLVLGLTNLVLWYSIGIGCSINSACAHGISFRVLLSWYLIAWRGYHLWNREVSIEQAWKSHPWSTHNAPPRVIPPPLPPPPPTWTSVAQSPGVECLICFDESRDTIFLPCGHLGVCTRCAARVTRCPVCKATIVQRITVYTP